MNQFTLYTISEGCYKPVYSGDELSYCLAYIKTNGLVPCRCMIMSPNKRRITFTESGAVIFGDMIQKASD